MRAFPLSWRAQRAEDPAGLFDRGPVHECRVMMDDVVPKKLIVVESLNFDDAGRHRGAVSPVYRASFAQSSMGELAFDDERRQEQLTFRGHQMEERLGS